MYIATIILGCLFPVFLTLMIILIVKAKKDDYYESTAIGVGVPSAVMSLFCLVFVSISLGVNLPSYNDKVSDIKTLKPSSTEISGDFFLGIGSIETSTYYCYYADLGYNRYSFEKIPTNKAIVIEDDSQKPHVQHIKEAWQEEYYEIYVPEGTIQIEWKL